VGAKALLLQTADPAASLTGDTTSGGRLDASAAVHCSNNGEVWIDSPSQGFVAPAGQPLPVRVIASRCASPTGVTVWASRNGAPTDLTPRGAGLYTGTYVPTGTGPVAIQATATAGTTSTETVSGTVPQSIAPNGPPVTVSMPTGSSKGVLAFAGTTG